ncbi:hypothetical protein Tco_0201068 [Tanacetum coccineum]
MTNNINHFRELVDQAWEKHSHNHFRAPTALDMEVLIKTCLMPLSIKTQNDSFTFVHELKQEMHADLKYVESLENEIDKLEYDKAEFSNMYDILLQECVSNDVMCSYLHSLSDLDAHSELQCLYLHKIVQLILFIVDSGCTKHMTDNISIMCNFVEKYLGTIRFGNDQFALILGYGDLVQGNITINKVYYIEGLNHNLFTVGQFCDADLEDFSHLNFDYINLLSKKDVVIGLPKLKYIKNQLCSFCEVNKAKRSSFKTKTVPSLKGRMTTQDYKLDSSVSVPWDETPESVQTRRQLATDPEMCMFALTVSIVEPKTIKEAMADSAWIEAMQEELHQFDRLKEEGIDFEELFALVACLEAVRIFVAYAAHKEKVYRLRKALYGCENKLQVLRSSQDPTVITQRAFEMPTCRKDALILAKVLIEEYSLLGDKVVSWMSKEKLAIENKKAILCNPETLPFHAYRLSGIISSRNRPLPVVSFTILADDLDEMYDLRSTGGSGQII